MHVELCGTSHAVNGRPLRFGRSLDCELTLPIADRGVPTLLGCVHYLAGEPAITNLHQSASFTVVSGRKSRDVAPDTSLRLRHRLSHVLVNSASGTVGFDVVLDDRDTVLPVPYGRLAGARTMPITSTPLPTFKRSHLRDLTALFEPTLRSRDFSVIRASEWEVAAARIGDTAVNLKGRVLRTIAGIAQQGGCPPISGPDGRQLLGRWLIDRGVLTPDSLKLLD